MDVLSRDKQIAVISALTEGCSIRAIERLTGIHRDTIMRLGVHVGDGCAEVHDRLMQFVQVNRLELDELWSYVGKQQKRITPTDPGGLLLWTGNKAVPRRTGDRLGSAVLTRRCSRSKAASADRPSAPGLHIVC